MGQLLTFYDHRKDKTKIRHGHSAFQELASINQTWDNRMVNKRFKVEQIDFFLNIQLKETV